MAAFINNNGGLGTLVSYETIDSLDINIYTVTITATNSCGGTTESLSYSLDVKEGCLTVTSMVPSTVVM